ncbi:MAG: helix-turn-helix domain-containing protein [Pseudonocardiaceae bacterium]
MARQPPELAEQQRLLGRYLAALRGAAGLYQTDIARAVPCHRTHVAHAEAGSHLHQHAAICPLIPLLCKQ